MSKITNAELYKLITDFKTDFSASNKSLSDKIDGFGDRLDKLDQRLDKIEENNVVHARKFKEVDGRIDEVDGRIDEVDQKATEGINSLVQRVSTLEGQLHQYKEIEIPAEIQSLRDENHKLKADLNEEIENSTNRQLRRTLIFRNIAETKDIETYAEVKTILADVISSNTQIPNQVALQGIERAHRETKRTDGSRNGKRNIYAAFHSWELAQRIIEEFRRKCIADRSFQIYVDQMYGPLTTQRRKLAYDMRKNLKDQGIITGGYVDFPARLMVNIAGDVDFDGKKKYKLHTNFSGHKVEKNR